MSALFFFCWRTRPLQTHTHSPGSEERKYRALLRQRLDAKMIAKLDRDGDGVDKAEFCVGMLIAMGLANEVRK